MDPAKHYSYRIFSQEQDLMDVVETQEEAFRYFLRNTEHISTDRVEQVYDGEITMVYDSQAIANYCRPILQKRNQMDLFE